MNPLAIPICGVGGPARCEEATTPHEQVFKPRLSEEVLDPGRLPFLLLRLRESGTQGPQFVS